MAELQYIKKQEKSNLLLLGVTEEGESARYTVTVSLYTAIGCPLRGADLDEYEMSEIKYADEQHRARKKALSLLALADNNEYNLKVKLIRYGIRREIADETVEEMVGLGYVNEKRQLERLILSEANDRLFGKRKIMARLVSKGYSSGDIRATLLELIERGDVDFSLNRERLIEKRLGSAENTEEVKKLLYKYGY